MKNRNLIDSFNNAISGILYTLRNERNMKIHCITAIGVFILTLFYKLSRVEFVVLCLTIALVIICELFNTAIEVLVDMIIYEFHPKAKIVKDVAAGAVLVASFFALIVAYIIFFDRVSVDLETGFQRIVDSKIHITFISLLVTIAIVLFLKAVFKKGTPFYGGMPSGHSAVAISLTTAVALLTSDVRIVVLCLFIALMVIQSRLEAKIHTVIELLLGGVIGFLVTILLFQFFNH